MVWYIDIDELPNILEVHYRLKEPLFISGPPGIGKSQTVIEFAMKKSEDLGRQFVDYSEADEHLFSKLLENPGAYFLFVDLRLYEFEPSEIKGLIYIDESRKKVDLFTWDWMEYFYKKQSAGIIFLDELNMAHPEIMKVAFKIVYDKVIGNKRIKGDVLVVAAGNPEAYNYLTNELPAPLMDRFAIYNINTSIKSWLKWALLNNINPIIIDFLSIFPSYLFYKTEVHREDVISKTLITPRTWHKLSNILNFLQTKYESEEFLNKVDVYASGYLTPDVKDKFMSFLRMKLKLEQYGIKFSKEQLLDLENLKKNIDNMEYLMVVIEGLSDLYNNGDIEFKDINDHIKVMYTNYPEMALSFVLRIYEKMKQSNKTETAVSKFLNDLAIYYPDLFNQLVEIIRSKST